MILFAVLISDFKVDILKLLNTYQGFLFYMPMVAFKECFFSVYKNGLKFKISTIPAFENFYS
jgi:hypothetical protein